MRHDDTALTPDPPTVERHLDLDAPIGEVWEVVRHAGLWLGDDGDLGIDQGRGAPGWVVEDGVRRRTRIEDVVEGRRLVFRWWEDGGDEGDASRVEISVLGSDGPTRLVVRETLPVPAGRASSARAGGSPTGERRWTGSAAAWEIRLLCLASLVSVRSAPVLV
jgi:uncharacterized protein YndB with AHSA1/START domain